jgi:predicted dehydrogenase
LVWGEELSLDATKVDFVLLESNDGRVHLEQALPVLKARKQVFIDKPIAASLADVLTIFRASEKYNTPVFTASSLRWIPQGLELRGGAKGKVLGADTFSPASLEPTHPDLYWYGIHGVEILYTVMGPGCRQVTRFRTADDEFCVGEWADGRIGTFRGTRKGPHTYGGTVFCEKAIIPLPMKQAYDPLIVEIAKFFETGKPPVPREEMLEIYAFMAAADASKAQGGRPARLDEVLKKAQAEAEKIRIE